MAIQQASNSVAVGADLLQRARRSSDAATAWILSKVAEDGEPVGGHEQNAYYRVPLALALAGERETASAVLSWIERYALTPEGDLRPGPAQGAFTHRWASYPLALIALGAWQLEREDTALQIMKTLEAFRDPTTGGAYGERPEIRRTSRQDLFPTAQLGVAALTTGRREVADGTFRWLVNLYEAQPDLPRRLFTGWDANGLITMVDRELEFELITDFGKPRQAFYNPGIAAAFLARYFMQTGETKARDLGRSYLQLSAEGTELQFDYGESKQICKFGWGASLMLLADPEGDHLGHVVRMAEWFIESQLEDGRWHNSPFLKPNPTDSDDLAVTAEFVQHLAIVRTALGGRALS